MVNLEWYRSFIAVYQVGTASGAAQVLHITQPAVSQHLAALELALGTALFERTSRKMLPTEAGKRLYNQIAAAMETLESITTYGSFVETSPIIRLGTSQEFFHERILEKLSASDQNCYVIQLGLTKDLIAQLQAGNLDAVVATQKILHPDIEYQLLFEESFWLVGPPNINISALQIDLVSLDIWLKNQSWIAYSEELPMIRRFWRLVFGRRININPKLIIPDLRGIRQAIALGFGFSVLPDYLCKDLIANNQLTLILQPEQSVTNQIWLALRKADKQTYKTKILLELVY